MSLTNASEEQFINIRSRDLRTLPFSTRALNLFDNSGLKTVGDLINKSDHQLFRYRNVGKKTIAHIKAVLANTGLALEGTPCPHCKGRGVVFIRP